MIADSAPVLALDRLLDVRAGGASVEPDPSWEPTLARLDALDAAVAPPSGLRERTWAALLASAEGPVPDLVAPPARLSDAVAPPPRTPIRRLGVVWSRNQALSIAVAVAVAAAVVVAVVGPRATPLTPPLTGQWAPGATSDRGEVAALPTFVDPAPVAFDRDDGVPGRLQTDGVTAGLPRQSRAPSVAFGGWPRQEIDAAVLAAAQASLDGLDSVDVVLLTAYGATATRDSLMARQTDYQRRVEAATADLRAALDWERWLVAARGLPGGGEFVAPATDSV
jgi:hypothetical protein